MGTFIIGYSSLCKILNADDYSGYFMFLKSCIFKNVHAFIQPMGEESHAPGGGGGCGSPNQIEFLSVEIGTD